MQLLTFIQFCYRVIGMLHIDAFSLVRGCGTNLSFHSVLLQLEITIILFFLDENTHDATQIHNK